MLVVGEAVTDDVTLYLGDCLEIMRGFPAGSVDAVVTDPPYGVNIASWDGAIPPQEYLDECLRLSRGPVVWFGAAKMIFDFANYTPIPDRVLIWAPAFTLNGSSSNHMFYRYHPILCWRLPKKQEGIMSDVIRDNTAGRNWWNHPGTKPVALMQKIVNAFGGSVVLDPFMGSGTTGVACVQTGRKFIGVEIDPDYFEIAKKRIEDARLQMRMPL